MLILKSKAKIDKRLLPVLRKVSDPEIPVLSLLDLGVIREAVLEAGIAKIKITPTYSGCPAVDMMQHDLEFAMGEAGYDVEIERVLHPAWTTDWLTEEGKKALFEYGIAPPTTPTADKKALMGEKHVIKCPLCKSMHTQMVSQFGSTACKAHFKCLDCGEPFDYFKCLI